MADSSLSSLNYGRPGLTSYDLDDRDWTFSRQPVPTKLKQIADWQLILSAAANLPPTQSPTNATTARKDARRLTHDYPQLVPATRQLPDLNAVSEAVTSAVTTYDPLIGDLLSYGTVFLDRGGRPKRIAALPAGISGNVLRLVVLGQQRHGWADEKSVWLSGLSMKDAESGYWNEDAAAIQQVCFAQTDSGNSFLAVRLPTKTVLLRPMYHRGLQAAKPSIHYELPPSLISAHPILSIIPGDSGEAPHADVAFNPEYQFQFGIIDQQSTWSIWQIERRAKRDEYSVLRLVQGSIMASDDANTDNGDGWARILWAGDSSTILVCNRRHLNLISIEGETFRHLPVSSLIPQRSTDWILDVKRHPQHQNRFFVLTSTRLFVLAVTTASATVDGTADQAGATIVSSRRHYRGDEDFTLQLSVQVLIDETCIFLYSRLNSLIQVCSLQDHPTGPPELVTSSDPVSLHLAMPAAALITHIHLDLLEYGTRANDNWSNGPAHSYLEREVPFYQLTVALSDLSVHQTVLLPQKYDVDAEPIAWSKTTRVNHLLYTSTDVEEMDDFVVPNGLDKTTTPTLKFESQTPRLLPSSNQPSAHRTIDYTMIYDALIHSDRNSTSTKDNTSFDSITERLRGLMVVDMDSSGLGPGYIMEIFDSIADVPDIDETSSKFDQLFESVGLQSSYVMQRIALPLTLRLPKSAGPSIASLYDTILQDWIATLPVEVPTRVRQMKERLARRVAAEVTLASVRLRDRGDKPLSQTSAVAGDAASLPILPSKLQDGGHPDMSADMLSQSLPTPPHSSVPPSSQPLSSPFLPESNIPLSAGDPLSFLRKHLVIDNDASAPTVISPSVTELLAHWQPGSDPNMYDWEATERALQRDAIDEASQEQREKQRKKKERREKRQRREDELMRAKTQTSSQPLFPRSSPGPMLGSIAGSSQVPIPMSSQVPSQLQGRIHGFGAFGGLSTTTVPQSQVEPGRFGGRPDKKKKKGKSRVSGF